MMTSAVAGIGDPERRVELRTAGSRSSARRRNDQVRSGKRGRNRNGERQEQRCCEREACHRGASWELVGHGHRSPAPRV